MADVKIQTRKNGPLRVEGPITLIDHDGNAFKVDDTYYLCRCGQSAKKPFCDGAHRGCGWVAEETAS